MPNIKQYEQEDGVIPFEKWFDSLGVKAALKVRTAMAQMEVGNFGDHKSVGGGCLGTANKLREDTESISQKMAMNL